ncbi:MAG: hypothetical protein AAF449_03375 [Myxococcota bacterium]
MFSFRRRLAHHRANSRRRPPLEGAALFHHLNKTRPSIRLYWGCGVFSSINDDLCPGAGHISVRWTMLDVDLQPSREGEPEAIILYDVPHWLRCDRCGRYFSEDGGGVHHVDWPRTLEALTQRLEKR